MRKVSPTRRSKDGLVGETFLINSSLSYIFTMPLKPMKAMARIPAEMRAMGMPFIEAGSSVRESCSRMPAKTTRASVKPIAMEIA